MDTLLITLRPVIAAEAAAEAYGTPADPEDVEQALCLRLLERAGDPPADPAAWVRAGARAEVRAARRRRRAEVPYRDDTHAAAGRTPDDPVRGLLAAEAHRAVRALPPPYRALAEALLSPEDLTYPEIARRLRVPQGSLGPRRSRCAARLRRLLAGWADDTAVAAWAHDAR
ncbi:hypothetical protein SRB5_42290 [Streptomyces sp. RB5]|uniref:RNA polymerase sigma factor n=1 Tax=Streptomyces smaragdinus TaxID=2585196 RepID=A0A7K0CKR2_9ACTN|nr:sigma-70 family RNA polymerase sigma factor [Streptomyces smaragdinus]MQY14068.1 hypothetical protein [Streptomyces smaragdinus]